MELGVTTAAPLSNLVAGLADNKQMLGRRYAEWCTAAPTLESAVAAAAMAQDEIGHARSLYPLLEDVAGKSPENDPETRTTLINAAFLNRPFAGWTDFVAANFLFDTALSVLIDAALDSQFGPLGQRARRIHEEEALHWLHGEGWVRRLTTKGELVRKALEVSLAAVVGDSCEVLDAATAELAETGVLNAERQELQTRFRLCVNPVLEETGLALV